MKYKTAKLESQQKRLPCAFALLSLAFVYGCTPTKAVEDIKPTPAMQASEEAKSNIRTQSAKVSQRGTSIRVIVNGEIITNTDIAKRKAFLKLRKAKGNRSKLALKELVDEKIKMQEAKKRNTKASDSQVDEAFKRFAGGNKLKPAQLTTVLNRNGITASHFKEFIRGQISWSRTVGSKFQSEVRTKARKNALSEIRKSGGKKPETNEYILQQVIFVVQKAKRNKTILKRRKAEAEAFRKIFQSCSTTKAAAVGQLDVTVRALPRVLEPQLPNEWSDEIIKTAVGQTTKTLETERGVEFLAVCSKLTTSDDNVAHVLSQSNEFKDFNKKGDAIAEDFLTELRSEAQIIYR